MTERFHWDWKTGRMKDTYSSFQATKDMRLIERQVNDACNSYEKQIAKLEKENEQLKQYKQAVSDVLKNWSQKNLSAKQLQVVIAIMEELNVMGELE